MRSEVKTMVVKARRTLTGGPVAESERYAIRARSDPGAGSRGVQGLLHRNNAGRRKARLADSCPSSRCAAGGRLQLAEGQEGRSRLSKPAARRAECGQDPGRREEE